MYRYLRIILVSGALALIAYLWTSLPPESLQKGFSGITEDPELALTLRLTGFIVVLTIAFYFAVKNITKGK
jgi:hypothetical protein